METEKLEISDICAELRKLTKAHLADRTNAACAQAASLLEILRETIIASRSNDPGVQRLKSILAAQGEG